MSEPYNIQFFIPGLPRMTNNSGRPTHWTIKMREARHWKSMVLLLTAGKRPSVPLEKASLMLVRYSSSEPDFDGLVSGFKHIIDGLKEAGVIANDKQVNIGQPKYLWEKAKPKEGKVFVSVREVKNGAP